MNRREKVARDRFRHDTEPHVWVVDPAVCREECEVRPCLEVCPSGVFSIQETEGGPELRADYRVCLECGACLYLCFRTNVHFEFPRGGFGVHYRYG